MNRFHFLSAMPDRSIELNCRKNLYVLVKICCTIPASSCECKRSASALRRPALLTGLLLLYDWLTFVHCGKDGKAGRPQTYDNKTSHIREQTKNSQNTTPIKVKDPAKNIEVVERVIKSDRNTPNELRVHSPSMLVN